MIKLNKIFLLYLFLLFFGCSNEESRNDQNKIKKVIEFLRQDSLLNEFSLAITGNNEIKYEIAKNNIYPALYYFNDLIEYKTSIDSSFSQKRFKSFLKDFKWKRIESGNKFIFFRPKPFKIYFTNIDNDLYCQVFHNDGYNLKEEESYVHYLGESLNYYFVFDEHKEIIKVFSCVIVHG